MRQWLAAVAVCVALVAAGVATARGAAPSVWEIDPYRVRVYLAFDRTAPVPDSVQQDLRNDLVSRAATIVGASWDLTVAAAPAPLASAMFHEPERLSFDRLPAEAARLDKVFLLSVVAPAGSYEVTAREIDVRTRSTSPPAVVRALHAAALARGLFEAVYQAFCPLAEVAAVDEQAARVTLRLRAAELPPRDPGVVLAAPGTVFAPIIRYDDREGNPRRIAAVPWTYLVVDNATSAVRECALYSGLHSPLSARRRGRVTQLALAVRPSLAATQVVLRSRTQADKVLEGYDVYQRFPGNEDTQFLARSGFDGSVAVPAVAGQPLVILYVKHGESLLARLPLVPGLASRLDAPLPDDDARLEAEGYVMEVRDRLIDIAARRAVVVPRARKAIADGRFEDAQALIRELETLGTREQLLRELATQEKRFVSGDPATDRKIAALFTETEKMVYSQIDPALTSELVESLAAARQSR